MKSQLWAYNNCCTATTVPHPRHAQMQPGNFPPNILKKRDKKAMMRENDSNMQFNDSVPKLNVGFFFLIYRRSVNSTRLAPAPKDPTAPTLTT